MKKSISIYLYGSTITLVGIVLIFSNNLSLRNIQLSLGITLSLGAIFAIAAAFSQYRKQVRFTYHELHALTMIVYGLTILIFGFTIEKLLSFTTFLFIFYSFSEIIFCNWLFNLSQKVAYKIVIVRVLLGMAIGVGTVIALNLPTITLEIFGVLFLMIGINIIFYAPVMESNHFNLTTKEFSQ